MSFAAVICASHAIAGEPGDMSSGSSGTLRAGLHFAGYSLVEYQVRQAAQAGASRVFILVGTVTQPLSRAIDRLTADGIAVALVRDMVSLVREAPRDKDMLLVADGAIIAQQHYAAIAAQPANVLLVADDSRATAALERIDGQHRWAGLLRVSPDLLFGTLDMLGDWDMELTLVRAAVQAGAHRIVVPQDEILEGRVALVDSQAAADLVAQAQLGRDGRGTSRDGAVDHYLLRPIALRIAPMLLRTQVPALQLRIGGMALAAIGMIAAMLDWPIFGMLLMLTSILASLTADRLGEMARRGPDDGWLALAPYALVLLGIVVVGNAAAPSLAGLPLAMLLGIVTLAVRWRRTGDIAPWALFTPATAVLFLILATLFAGVQPGISAATLCAIASVGMMVLMRRA